MESSTEDNGDSTGDSRMLTTEGLSTRQIGGTYAFGEDIEKGPIGSIRIYPITDSTAFFFLDVNRGSPSYNMGQIQGKMVIDNRIGHYSANPLNETQSCELIFEFSQNSLIVTSVDGQNNCGFGFGVYADHEFKVVDHSIPQFFIYGPGDTIRFEDLLEK